MCQLFGGKGGSGSYRSGSSGYTAGGKGENGVNRGTGGGSGGCVYIDYEATYKVGGTSGSGGYGLSYSGGAGGGMLIQYGSCKSAHNAESVKSPYVTPGRPVGSEGGTWIYKTWGYSGAYTSAAGGLLVIYGKTISNMGTTSAQGVGLVHNQDRWANYAFDIVCAGGGSINIFYENLLNNNVIVGKTNTINTTSYNTYGGTGDFEIGKIENGIYHSLGM